MSIKVCLDAGHYGKYNRSPAVASYYESDLAWKFHKMLKAELEKLGVEVITTREKQNTNRGLYERGAASKGCHLFLSVHSNAVAGGINENIDYPVAYVLLNGSSTDIGLKLAKVVEDVMGTSQKGRTATRRGSNGEYYGVLRGASAVGTPGVILEHSFHTNTRSTKWLLNDTNLQKLAKAEAECIAAHFGTGTENQWYRVRRCWSDAASQKGAFRDLDKAKKCADENEGYRVFDESGKAIYPNKEFEPYPVRVSIEDLYIRKGPGTDYDKIGYIPVGTYTIVEEADGRGATMWGRLKSGAGWISLDFATRI